MPKPCGRGCKEKREPPNRLSAFFPTEGFATRTLVLLEAFSSKVNPTPPPLRIFFRPRKGRTLAATQG
jgi:hypothetical protein